MFSEYLLDIHHREIRKLKEAESQVDTFRAQGSVGILDVLMRVKEDLRGYLNDIREGKAVPIVETPKEVISHGLAGKSQR